MESIFKYNCLYLDVTISPFSQAVCDDIPKKPSVAGGKKGELKSKFNFHGLLEHKLDKGSFRIEHPPFL